MKDLTKVVVLTIAVFVVITMFFLWPSGTI